MTKTINYKNCLEHKDWSFFSWSIKNFKQYKKKFKKIYKEAYWISFNTEVPNPKARQVIYETLLRVQNTWVFSNDTYTTNLKINEDILLRSHYINNLILNIKEK